MDMPLQDALAPRIAPVVVANLTMPFPYHDSHLFRGAGEVADPMVAHPAFGNSYDWHSSVHSHWAAMALVAHVARGSGGAGADSDVLALRAAIARNLTPENLAVEGAYLSANPWYERPYGRAWALALAAAAARSSVDDLRALVARLRAMARPIADGVVDWLEVMPAPVRHGTHANTAFALGLFFDAAGVLGFDDLTRAVTARAKAWFADDREYPQAWERSAHDFLSPGLAEADLMRRASGPDAFAAWWSAFLGSATIDAEMFAIADVPNVADGQIVHLHGLNLSRAGMLARIATALHRHREPGRERGAGDDARALLERARHLYAAGVDHAAGDDYLSTHWLATFAWDAAASLDAAGAAIA